MPSNVFVRGAVPLTFPTSYTDYLLLDLVREPRQSTIEADVDRLIEACGLPTSAGTDFLLLSTAIYVADKKILRRSTPDRWTRELHFNVPVAELSHWESVSPALSEALGFLTGDRWSFTWRNGRNVLRGTKPHAPSKYGSVCLFSGGLDSLIGAIDLLESKPEGRILLLGHYDSRLTPGTQKQLADALAEQYGPDRVQLLQISVRPAPPNQSQAQALPAGRETTTRSRSIVFLGLALAAASTQGPSVPVFVPENGFIALNVPLIDARLGSSSTRTTHPHFLYNLRRVLDGINLTNPIINPYLLSTKGEMLRNCRNQALLKRLIPLTVSCSHPEAGRYEGGTYGNCGYCFPCLIRRASLHAIGLDNPEEYRRDACTNADLIRGRGTRGRDLRAILTSLASGGDPTRRGMSAPALAGPLHEHSAQTFQRIYLQGRAELHDLFLEKSRGEVRSFAGL